MGSPCPNSPRSGRYVRDPERQPHKCEDGGDDGPGHGQAQIRSPVERGEHRPRDRDEREPADQLQRLERRACRVLRVEGRHRRREADDDQSGVHHTHQGQHRRRLARPRHDLPDNDARDERKDQDDEEPQRRKTAGSASMMVNAAVARPIGGAMTAIATATSAIPVSSGTLWSAVAPSSGSRSATRPQPPRGSPLHAVECPRAATPQGARRYRLDEADVRGRHHRIGHPPAGGSSSDDGVAGLPRGHVTGGPRGTRER